MLAQFAAAVPEVLGVVDDQAKHRASYHDGGRRNGVPEQADPARWPESAAPALAGIAQGRHACREPSEHRAECGVGHQENLSTLCAGLVGDRQL